MYTMTAQEQLLSGEKQLIAGGQHMKTLIKRNGRNLSKLQAKRKNLTTVWDKIVSRMGAYQREGKEISVSLRHLGLARALLSGKNYLDVEQSVRENNEANPEMVADFLEIVGVEHIDETIVKFWLSDDGC